MDNSHAAAGEQSLLRGQGTGVHAEGAGCDCTTKQLIKAREPLPCKAVAAAAGGGAVGVEGPRNHNHENQ
jgi:hypothetical protein